MCFDCERADDGSPLDLGLENRVRNSFKVLTISLFSQKIIHYSQICKHSHCVAGKIGAVQRMF